MLMSMVLLIIGSYFLWVLAGKSSAREVRPKRVIVLVAPIAALVAYTFLKESPQSGALLGIVFGTALGYEIFSFICHEEGFGVTRWLKNFPRHTDSTYYNHNSRAEQEATRRRETPPSPSSHSR
jgi:hypothetical protein